MAAAKVRATVSVVAAVTFKGVVKDGVIELFVVTVPAVIATCDGIANLSSRNLERFDRT
jgi:hypothetical protein